MNSNIINSIFFPRKSRAESDDKDLLIQVEKEIKVGVRFFLKSKTYDNILFFHGNAEIAQEYDYLAQIYNKFEFNLIVADYRGYGISNGNPSKDNLHNDSLIIFDRVKDILFDDGFKNKLFVMGRSLGSASAWEICRMRENDVDGCIIESGFATESFIFKLFSIPENSSSLKISDGFGNLEKIKSFLKPVLFIHSKEDHIVPFEQAEMAYKCSKSELKKIFVVESTNHNNIISTIGTLYFKKIKEFTELIK